MLERWINKLNALCSGGEGLNIVIAGDSSFSGMWAGNFESSAAGIIYRHFKEKYGPSSYTQGAYQPLAQPFPAISEFNYTRYYGTWIEWTGTGVARGPLSFGDSSGGMSRVFTGEGFRLYMAGWPYYSQMSLKIDGGGPITVMGGDPDVTDYVVYESPRLPYGAHSFDLKVNGTSSSGACIYAVEIIESFGDGSGESGGVRLHNLSVPGLKTGDMFTLNEFVGNRNTNLPCAFGPFSPDLAVICLGSNDIMSGVPKADFRENYGNILRYIKGIKPDADILLVSHGLVPDGSNSTGMPQGEYLETVARLSEEFGAPYLDFCSLWSDGYALTPAQMNEKYGYYPENDFLHPNDSGHAAMAETILNIIDPPPTELPFTVRFFGDTPIPVSSGEAALYIKYKGDGRGIYASVPGSGIVKL